MTTDSNTTSRTPASRTNRILVGAAVTVGVLAGAAGVTAAVTGGAGTPDLEVSRAADEGHDDDGYDDGVDDDEGEGRDDDGDDGEEGDPALAADASVSQAQAEQAALAEAPGTVHRTHIEMEDGVVVWDVEVDAADGTRHDLQIDATSGAVVEHDIDD